MRQKSQHYTFLIKVSIFIQTWSSGKTLDEAHGRLFKSAFFRPGLIPASLSVKVIVQNRHILRLTNVAYGCEIEK